MNRTLTENAGKAGQLLSFLIQSSTRYRLHSPFLYQLVEEVIRSKMPVPDCEPVELLRKQYHGSREVILKTDYGRTSDGNPQPRVYPVNLGHIARTSLTSQRHCQRLYLLARFIDATAILEIGTSLGITSAYFSIAQPDGSIITLEGCPELSRLARENFSKLGIRNIEVLTGPFSDTLAPALEKLGKVDLVYVDGNHCKQAMLEYFEKCLEYATNDTVIVFDDIHRSKGTSEAWQEILQRDEVRISLDLFFSGWIFFRRESSREHFKLRYI